jgi:hypothetical protein
MAAVLFVDGVRLSTWICAAAFILLALRTRDWRPLAAAAAWMWGFEIVFQVISIAEGHHDTSVAARLGWILVGLPVVALLTNWVRPDRRLLLAAGCCFAAWVLIGFHVNDHTAVGFDSFAEALNEAAKTLWAVAYLVPLLGASSIALARVSGLGRALRTPRRGVGLPPTGGAAQRSRASVPGITSDARFWAKPPLLSTSDRVTRAHPSEESPL